MISPAANTFSNRPSALFEDARAFIHLDSHVRERDPRPQRKRVERRTIDRHRPVALRRQDAARGISVRARPCAARPVARGRAIVIPLPSPQTCAGSRLQLARKPFDRLRLIGLEHRRQKFPNRLRIHDAVCDLLRLRRHQPAPDRISLRPHLFAFVVESPRAAGSPRCRTESHPGASRFRHRISARAHRRRWHEIPSGRRSTSLPCFSSAASIIPSLYGVPRTIKFSAASPQCRFSHSIFAS